MQLFGQLVARGGGFCVCLLGRGRARFGDDELSHVGFVPVVPLLEAMRAPRTLAAAAAAAGADARCFVLPPASVLPAHTIEAARSVVHWVVETPKAARAFLRTLAMPGPIAELSIRELGETPSPSHLKSLLGPLQEGHDVAMLSDAGCPGVADPGAALVGAAHAADLRVVPLVGPSAIVLALMASGLDGQRFSFHGYLPASHEARAHTLRVLETESRDRRCTQLFIETPYRNVAMLETMLATLRPATRLCIACDLTLTTETIVSQPLSRWRGRDLAGYAKRPAIFLMLA